MTPTTPAAAQAMRHEARKPSEVQGLPSLLARMMVERFVAVSNTAFSGAPTGIMTRAPVFDQAISCSQCRWSTTANLTLRSGRAHFKLINQGGRWYS